MNNSVKNFNSDKNFEMPSEPSQLERKYIELYGQEFVDDLKNAFFWMKKDMENQLPFDEEIRRKRCANSDLISAFYVDFQNEDFYSQTMDDMGGKTICNYGHSPCLKTKNDHNIRYLLSGLYLYDKNKSKKWLKELLGEGGKIWFEKV